MIALVRALCAIVLAGAALPLAAQTWPTRPLRVIVPFTPGGASDIAARVLAEHLSAPLGQTLVVDNRTGASGTIGAEIVARAQPDGYTLLLMDISLAATTALAANKAMATPPRYDAMRDFQHVALVMRIPFVAVVHPSIPAKSIADYIALAKTRKITYGSAGTGSAAHLAAEMLRVMSSIELTHIPYKGAAAATADLLGGQIDSAIVAISTVLPHVKAGRLRALGLTTDKRSPVMPDVPTISEAGVTGYDFSYWTGISAPRGTPKMVTARLNEEIARVQRKPEVASRFATIGADIIASSEADASAYVDTEIRRWTTLVKKMGLKGE